MQWVVGDMVTRSRARVRAGQGSGECCAVQDSGQSIDGAQMAMSTQWQSEAATWRLVSAVRARVVAVAVAVMVILGVTAGSAAATPSAVGVKARINGRDIASINQNRPVRLRPDQQVIIDLTVTNNSARNLSVRSVNLNGVVLGLTFFAFETRIDLLVAPGATETTSFAVELIGLNGQATGLLPANLQLLGEHRNVISRRGFATDVRGSMQSVYGVFGLLIALITVLFLLAALIRLASHRMSTNRWSRATRFGTAGLGLGLTLTFSLSAFRVLLPKPSSWLTIVFLSTIVLFILGYLTPTPVTYADDFEENTQPDNATAVTAPAR